MRSWHSLIGALCAHALFLAIPWSPKVSSPKDEVWLTILEPHLPRVTGSVSHTEISTPVSSRSPEPEVHQTPPEPQVQELLPQAEAVPEIPEPVKLREHSKLQEPPVPQLRPKPAKKPKSNLARAPILPKEAPSPYTLSQEKLAEQAPATNPIETAAARGWPLEGPRREHSEGPKSLARESPIETTFGSFEGPRFLRKVIPDYPLLARRMRREGTVLLRLHIDEGGRLLEARVVERAGYGLDEAALEAVRRSTFAPATKAGGPVECWATLAVRFVLEDRR